MLKFLDGPAAGQVLACSRAPLFLRVVQSQSGDWDALDKLDDKPAIGETIYVYIMTENYGWVHYDGRDKNGKRFGRTEYCADYRLFSRQPEDAEVRDNGNWGDWATARAKELQQKE